MRTKILSMMLAMMVCSISYGQGLWQKVESSKIDASPSELVEYISDYEAFTLDYAAMLKKLERAPKEFTNKKGLKMEIPMPDGSLEEVLVFRTKMMEDGLSKKFPLIQNYSFISKRDGSISGKFAVSQLGFLASISTGKGKVYIDRYADGNAENYVSYYTTNYTRDASMLPSCGVTDEMQDKFLEGYDFDNAPKPTSTVRSPEGAVTLRTYRIAIATTGEFGQQKGGNTEDVLAVINESVVRLNEIFESEVAIRFLLVADNDKIIHLNPSTDPYINANQGAQLIGQNTVAIGNIIPLNEWDIGHVYTSSCTDVGGIASLQSVCGPSKGNGVTCHYSNNLDLITTRVAAHEIGHQFGAQHTFNHCDGENESSSSGFEPGSGHTIMSYAGGCGPALNVANAPYIYYHGYSIEQMITFSQTGNGDSCPEYIETGNTYPQIDLKYEDKFYIPIETPFKLTGEVTDAEDTDLTYSWEEFDLGPLTTPGEPILDAPQFVSEVPNSTPERILPELTKILTNNFDKLEVLPFYDKDMTWRLTARDNNSEAGGAEWKEVQFFATEQAGPFLVEYPNAAEDLIAGTTETILWDVANTDGDLVKCEYVNILLSNDGGLTYPYTLASYTPNDGSHDVIIPNAEANFCRVMVEAADNIFFDLSNTNSKILPATEASFSALAVPGYQQVCLPEVAEVQINTEQYLGFDEMITFEVIDGLPAGAAVNFAQNPLTPGESTTMTIDASTVLESSSYELLIKGTTATREFEFTTIVDLTSSDFSELAILSPAKGESGIIPVPTFTWIEDTDAESYVFELSDNPDFTNGAIVIKEEGLTTNSLTIEQPLSKNTIYFWRVSGVNRCGQGFTTALSTFATEALSCLQYAENEVPVSLPSSGTPTTILESVIVANGQVSDVNVDLFKGTHTRVKDLRVTLKSPEGTTAVLFDNRCAGSTSFSVGFDSESPAEIQCPMLNAAVYKPEESLEIFNGEELQGTWELIIEDLKSGDGGKVTDYILNVCSNASLNAPVLDRNDALFIGPGGGDLINQGRLLVLDDNDDDDLVYTIVEATTKGDLKRNGTTLLQGETFTQDDLNNNRITYLHDGVNTAPDTDKFVFVVDDSEGGWIDLTTFNINIDIASDVEDNSFTYEVLMYPNPTDGIFYIDVANAFGKEVSIEVVNILGQVVLTKTRNASDKVVLDMTEQASGNYFVKLEIEGETKVFKVTKR